MALNPPQFRRKFPLLVTGSLLLLGSSVLQAAEQFDCQASASGWSCANSTASTSSTTPARPTPAPVEKPVSESVSVPAVTSRSAVAERLDWVPRAQLEKTEQANIPPCCEGAYVEPARQGAAHTPDKDGPTFVSARASSYDQHTETATLAGEVVVRQGNLQVEADEVSLNQKSGLGTLEGNIRLRDKGVLISGQRAEVQLDSGEAKIENADYVLHEARARGHADYVKREENAVVRLKGGTYTRCEPDSNAWQLKGNNVTLNPETGFGTATNVTLRVNDVPIFYTPYLYFPIDSRRQSGFLMPSFSTSRAEGFTVQTPYYVNLAPNYDLTLYPAYMEKRGLLNEAEFRYQTPSSEGRIGGAQISDQDNSRHLQSEYQDQRWMYNIQHRTGLDTRWQADINYSDISDPYYFQDLSTNLSMDTPDFLNQQAGLTYQGDSYKARINMHAYAPATVVSVTPYERLPQITFNGTLPVQPAGLVLGYDTEFVRFSRNLKNGNFIDENGVAAPWYDSRLLGLARSEGDRTHLEPSISVPLENSWGFIKPSVKYAYTRYDLSIDQQGRNTLLAEQQFGSSQTRQLPIYSVDSGLYFERATSAFGKGTRQTLEPRAFYLYVPQEDQTDLPIFDSSESAFSYASLWRENRFSGKDRIGDANQLSLGLTSRWLESNGFERQRLAIGQAFYFADRTVQLPGLDYRTRTEATNARSPYALQYVYRFNRDWRFSSEYNWDQTSSTTRSGSAMFHYQPQSTLGQVVNVGYRYRNDIVRYDRESGQWTANGDYGRPSFASDNDPSTVYIKNYYKISQHDVSTIWPLAPQWSLIARWQHDYNRNRTLEAFGGFEYDSCCWKLRVINRYWVGYDEVSLDPRRNDIADHGIFLQVVFKGLGGVAGNKVESFLDQGIQGYRERENQAF